MKTPRSIVLSLLCLAGCVEESEKQVSAPVPLKSGFEFLTAETQKLQTDSFENPGYLWVEQGESLFRSGIDSQPSCASCHVPRDLRGASATFPKIEPTSGQLINLEGQINLCRERYQNLPDLSYESDDLLALTTYIGNLSLGMPINVTREPQTEEHFRSGQKYFHTRRGQLNLSCSQCHDKNWGKQLRGDTISQGHGNGFPTYRFEWESLGSLHQRFSDCDQGVRAEPKELGSETYIDLEYYLAIRAQGLPIETPSVRR